MCHEIPEETAIRVGIDRPITIDDAEGNPDSQYQQVRNSEEIDARSREIFQEGTKILPKKKP